MQFFIPLYMLAILPTWEACSMESHSSCQKVLTQCWQVALTLLRAVRRFARVSLQGLFLYLTTADLCASRTGSSLDMFASYKSFVLCCLFP